ncbi:DUF1992 domain-containing protein [Virgibacillus sp. MSJ-26]|uniref:DnaJ family domain-containing protein n=1 Tax=Virgibacillus sp. MSJ-26 TaxID=2841522 RepID=UPI001C0F4050|nr:DnaJ family domain-containing protein [Virgibacillus sp. MSJ-26]MBU5466174.1 DUF1992 domain-containing protein [Virgibacillus sp. MSJ-26]
MDRKYNDLIGDILENSGEKDNYTGKGKGKPLNKNYMERNILQNFQEKAKEAGFLPPWLKLQKEISSLVHLAETESDIETINQKIKKYNTMCPPPMQKSPVGLDNLEKAKNIW